MISPTCILHYNFENVSSTIIPDITEHGFTGVIRGDSSGTAHMGKTSVFGSDRPILILDGGANGGYLQIPDGVLANNNGITLSFFCCINSTPDYGCIYSFGQDCCFYLLSSNLENDPDHFLLFPAFTNGGRSQEQGYWHGLTVRKNQWFHIAVTLNNTVPSLCTIYIDGIMAGKFTHKRICSNNLISTSFCCFGHGVFGSEPVAAAYTDISIYASAFTVDEIKELFSINPNTRFELERNALLPLFNVPVTSDIIFPSSGIYGCQLFFSSSLPSVISSEGSVTRPQYTSSDANVTITVFMKYGNNSCSSNFQVTVPAEPSADEIVRLDLADINFSFPLHTISNITLPTSGMRGSRITWKSSNTDYISNTGKVTQTDTEHYVTLTAYVSYGKAVICHDFIFHILSSDSIILHSNETVHADIPVLTSPIVQQVSLCKPSDVKMTDTGILCHNRDRCIKYLLLLDSDRMLYNFRKAFGVDTKGAIPIGGWEEPAGLLRGHSTGHYLSALAYAYAYTGNQQLMEKSTYLISELRKLQLMSDGRPEDFKTAGTPSNSVQSIWSHDPCVWGKGFLSAYSPDQFALLEQFTKYANIWAPYYTLHKLLAGFIDQYRLCHNETALACASGIADWIRARLSQTSASQRAQMWSMYIAGEYGGINESLAVLSQLTGTTSYLETAALFDNPGVFKGLLNNKDTIHGIHANQHIPQIIGALAMYKAGASSDYYKIARNFWYLVINHYTYSIGGVGRGEVFKEPDILAANIESNRNCETCATYNMLKLSAMLYEYEPDNSCYMDYYERALLNQISASQSPRITAKRHNGVTYMLPIAPGTIREYSDDYNDFTCCHGTGMENHVRYSENIYHISNNILYVNLYIGSSLYWPQHDMHFSLITTFPSQLSKLNISGNGHCILKLRVPYWCRNKFSVTFRNQTFNGNNQSYLTIEADFHEGDFLIIHTPFNVHLCFTPDTLDGDRVASIMYGPIVMVAKSQKNKWITLNLTSTPEMCFKIEDSAYPLLTYENLEFIPMNKAHHMPYHTYFKIR